MRRIFATLNQDAQASEHVIADLKNNINLLTGTLKPYRGKITAALMATVVVALSSLAGPYLMKLAIDDFILPGNLQGLGVVAALMLVSYALYWWSSYWQTYLAGWVGQVVIARIRADLFSRMQRLPMKFYDARQTGELMSRVTHDVNTLTDLISNGFVNLVSDIATVGVILILMFYLHSGLTLVIFLLLPLVVLIFLVLGNKMRRAYQRVRQEMARLNAGLEENLSGIRTVKALSQEKNTQARFNKLSESNVQANLQAVGVFSLFFPAMNFTRVLGEAVIFGYGGLLVIEGEMTLGILAAFLGYLRRFFRPVLDLSQVYNTYQQAAAALDRINHYLGLPVEEDEGQYDDDMAWEKQGFEVDGMEAAETVDAAGTREKGQKDRGKNQLKVDNHLKDTNHLKGKNYLKGDYSPEEVSEAEGYGRATKGWGRIIFDNVYFAYSEHEPYILQGVYFTVPGGESVSLVGESGAGKSTVVKLLTRLYEPSAGKIFLDGMDIQKIPLTVLRRRIGVFSQNVHLFNRSIADNIRYGRFEASQEQIEWAARKAHIHDFISRLPDGYASRVGQEGIKLSGGQRQLIALARLFLKNPRVLVLDEPTSNVDVHTEAQVVKAIKSLMEGRTVLVISHRESTVSFTGNRLILASGRIRTLNN